MLLVKLLEKTIQIILTIGFRKLVIKIGEVIIMDKTKADTLLSLGFKYTTRKIDNKEVFVFIQTNELMKELNSKFEEGSFLLSKTLKF